MPSSDFRINGASFFIEPLLRIVVRARVMLCLVVNVWREKVSPYEIRTAWAARHAVKQHAGVKKALSPAWLRPRRPVSRLPVIPLSQTYHNADHLSHRIIASSFSPCYMYVSPTGLSPDMYM